VFHFPEDEREVKIAADFLPYSFFRAAKTIALIKMLSSYKKGRATFARPCTVILNKETIFTEN
jgi:hypothetical protein